MSSGWTVAELVKHVKAKDSTVTALDLYAWCASHCNYRWNSKVPQSDDDDHFPLVKVGKTKRSSMIRDVYIDGDDIVQFVVTHALKGTTVSPAELVTAYNLAKQEDADVVDRLMGYPAESNTGLGTLAGAERSTKGGLVLIASAMDDRGELSEEFDLSGLGVKYFPPPNPFILGTLTEKLEVGDVIVSVKPWIINGHFQALGVEDVVIDMRGNDMIRYADNMEEDDNVAIAQAISIAYNRVDGPDADFKIDKANLITLTFADGTEHLLAIEALRNLDEIKAFFATTDGKTYLGTFTGNTATNTYFDAGGNNETLFGILQDAKDDVDASNKEVELTIGKAFETAIEKLFPEEELDEVSDDKSETDSDDESVPVPGSDDESESVEGSDDESESVEGSDDESESVEGSDDESDSETDSDDESGSEESLQRQLDVAKGRIVNLDDKLRKTIDMFGRERTKVERLEDEVDQLNEEVDRLQQGVNIPLELEVLRERFDKLTEENARLRKKLEAGTPIEKPRHEPARGERDPLRLKELRLRFQTIIVPGILALEKRIKRGKSVLKVKRAYLSSDETTRAERKKITAEVVALEKLMRSALSDLEEKRAAMEKISSEIRRLTF